MKSRSFKYTLVRANGEVESVRVPIFDPLEVAARLPHTMTFLHLPKKYRVMGFNRVGGTTTYIQGPAVALIEKGEFYPVDHAPVDDRDALYLWRGIQA
jgi:hypothetical protein